MILANTLAKIVFMGTPDFAVPSLEGLIEAGYEIAGVVTQPDRKKRQGPVAGVFSGENRCSEKWPDGISAGKSEGRRLF